MPWTLSRPTRFALAIAVTGLGVVAPLAGAPAHAANAACPAAQSSSAVSCTYGYTGGEQTYTVPAGVHSVRITAVGAPGNASPTGAGGFGASVAATVAVQPGATLYVEVGGTGAREPTPNFNGGGPGGKAGGGGGGASDVRTCSMNDCTFFNPTNLADCQLTAQHVGLPNSACSLDPRLVVAGGGGGGGTNVAGGSAGDPAVSGPGSGGNKRDGSPALPGDNGGFGGPGGAYYGAPPYLGWGGSLCWLPVVNRVGNQIIASRWQACQPVVSVLGSGGGGGGYLGGGAGYGFVPGYPKNGGGGGSSYWVPAATDTSMATDSTGVALVTITALNAPQSITFTSTPPTGATVGGSYLVGADASSGLPVSFSVDPASTAGACSISGASVSFDHAGTCIVDADQPGDANYAPAPRVSQTITIGPATPGISWPDPADIQYGTALGAAQLDATASVSGTFDYTPPIGTLLDVGTHSLAADFTPTDSNDYTAASATASITVVPADTFITVSAAPDPAGYGDSVTLAAVLSHASGASGTLPPGGTVTFTVDGQQVGAPVPVGNDRASSMAVAGLGAGTHTIAASYSGDARYLPATDEEQLTVQRATQTVAFTSAPPTNATYGDSYVVSAAASSGLPVQLSVDPSSTAGACTLSGTTVTFRGVGTCVLDADQPGNTDYAPAARVHQSFGIGKATPAVAWNPPGPITFGTALGARQLDATAAVPGTFSYSPAAGTVLGAGTHTLRADFTPDDTADYNSATVSTTITVLRAEQHVTITSTPPGRAVVGGRYLVAATASSALPVTLAIAPESAGVCVLVGADQVRFVGAGTCTIQASQPGDADFAPAAVVTQSVRVQSAPSGSSTAAPPSGSGVTSSTSGGTSSATSSTGGAGQAGGGSLSATGQPIAAALVAGALLIAGGALLAFAATRRGRRAH